MTRPSLLQRLADRHAERARGDLLRRQRTVERAAPARVVLGGRELINFASNDYLGLAGHPALADALAGAALRWGVGATAAHGLGGHRAPHEALEAELAEWTQRPRALLFSSGWMANLGVLATLLEAGDLCVQDKLNHACLLDGAKLAGATLRRYPHRDADAAARQLALEPDAGALLATDGVFSMDGTLAPLRELATACAARGATLMVDDAHGIGVLGPDGAGSVRAAGLGVDDVPVYMGTLGKALGTLGAFVAGDAALIDALRQFARTHVFTTALPPALAEATRAAVRIARFEGWRRDKLAVLVRHFRRGAAVRGIPLLDSATPIQPVVVGSSARAVAVAAALEAAGFHVPAVRPPTVPEGSARLRVTLTAVHGEPEVEALLDALAHALGQCPDASDPRPAEAAREPRRAPRAGAVRVRRRPG
jgi:8-amino-7-oxononanoate synthase